MTEKRLGVLWKGEIVGYLVDPIPDMAYLNGSWEPAETTVASRFEAIIRRQDARQAYEKLDGQWIDLVEADDKDQADPLPAIVISLSEGNLFVRRIFSQQAQAPRPRRKPWWHFW